MIMHSQFVVSQLNNYYFYLDSCCPTVIYHMNAIGPTLTKSNKQYLVNAIIWQTLQKRDGKERERERQS